MASRIEMEEVLNDSIKLVYENAAISFWDWFIEADISIPLCTNQLSSELQVGCCLLFVKSIQGLCLNH